MIIALIILIVMFIGIVANIEDVRKSGNLFKTSLFSIILGLLGIIGGEFIPDIYFLSGIAFLVLLFCILIGIMRFIFSFNIGKLNTLLVLNIILIFVFEILARANNIGDFGKEYVIMMVSGRNIFIFISLVILIIKAYRMIFIGGNKEDQNNNN